MNKRGVIDKLVNGVPVFLILTLLIALYIGLVLVLSSSSRGPERIVGQVLMPSSFGDDSFMFSSVEIAGRRSLFFNELLILARLKIVGDDKYELQKEAINTYFKNNFFVYRFELKEILADGEKYKFEPVASFDSQSANMRNDPSYNFATPRARFIFSDNGKQYLAEEYIMLSGGVR